MNLLFIDYREKLLEALADREEAKAYLNACLRDEDPRVFLAALKNVLQAQGSDITNLAKKAWLTRASLARMISSKANPKLASILALLKAMGYQLIIEAKTTK